MIPGSDVVCELPSGYAAAPVLPGQEQAALRVCAVLRKEPDPVSGHWVVLRDTMEARVLLGVVADSGGTCHRFVEIWVQALDTAAAGVALQRDALTNRVLDERWARQHRAFAAADAGAVITTGWESRHPPPTLIDIANLRPVGLPSNEQGTGWRLCEDDALLRDVGLPPYSGSLDRYLYQPKLGKSGPFIAVTPGAPVNDRTQPLDDLLAKTAAVPFNAAGGLLLVRDHGPLGYEQFLDVLRTGHWDGVRHGRAVLHPVPALDAGSTDPAAAAGERLFLARHGAAGQFVETFYLRLCALAGAVAATRDVVEQTQRPLLNVSADSFRVNFGKACPGLPFLWTFRVGLADAGDAVPLAVKETETRYFLRGRSSGTTVYQPLVREAGRGRGTFRIRQVLPEARGIVVEGTFAPQVPLAASRNDLLRVRLSVAAGQVDLYTRLQPEMALAGGEWRLRSVPQSLSEAAVAQLRAAEGVPFANVESEHIPLLSAPVDLYALAVLAVRTLLCTPARPVAVALDEAYSLARQVALEFAPGVPLARRIGALFEKDARWAQSLGPQYLATSEGATSNDVRDLLPAPLWRETLALLVRMFPGVGPDSYCADYGDAAPSALHRTFDAAATELDALLAKARSLIVADWRFNGEVQGVIRQLLNVSANPPSTPTAASRAPADRRVATR